MKSPLASALLVLFAAAAAADGARCQSCGTGLTLLKNDILPANPTGSYRFGIVKGLCNGEAAMSYFNYGAPCTVRSVSVLFANQQGTNGVLAAVDVEIYDGATFLSGGKVTLGKLLYKLSNGGSNVQIKTTALNTITLPKAVKVSTGTPVIGIRMVLNAASGSCSQGYTSNLCVDAAGTCTGGRNILATSNYGTIDPNKFPLFCPLYFNGSWVIRACVQPDVSVQWTGNATPGGVVSFTFNAPGQSGNGYFLVMSGGIKTGWKSPWGTLPVDKDWVFDCFLTDCAPILVNRQGTFNSSGKAFGGLLIPNSPILKNSGFTMYAAFVTYKLPNFLPWVSISAASQPIVIN